MKLTFSVTIKGPWTRSEIESYSRKGIASYIGEAVLMWGRNGDPNDLVWDIEEVVVKTSSGQAQRISWEADDDAS